MELKTVSPTKIATVAGINAKTPGSTILFTVPPGYKFIPFFVHIRVTNFVAGAKAIQAIASFGCNPATYDDYLNSITYTIAAQDRFIRDSVEDSALPIYTAGQEFRIIIETGSDATTETWTVDVFGYLITV